MRISIGAGVAIMVMGLSGAALGAVDGAAVYSARCSTCHGPDGQGSPMGPAIRGNKFILGSNDRYVADVIRNGRTGTAKLYANISMGMPGQKMTDEELNAVVQYVRKLAGMANLPE